MLSYYKISSLFGKDKANFANALIINFVYIILITPGLYFIENPVLSRYWFFITSYLYDYLFKTLPFNKKLI